MDGGISSFLSLSAALLIGTPPPNEAASNPAPSTPDVPWGRSWGPSDPCELTPATLLLLLLRDRIWKLPLLLWRVMLSVESFAEGVSVTWSWPGGCFPVKGIIANKILLCQLTSTITQTKLWQTHLHLPHPQNLLTAELVPLYTPDCQVAEKQGWNRDWTACSQGQVAYRNCADIEACSWRSSGLCGSPNSVLSGSSHQRSQHCLLQSWRQPRVYKKMKESTCMWLEVQQLLLTKCSFTKTPL